MLARSLRGAPPPPPETAGGNQFHSPQAGETLVPSRVSYELTPIILYTHWSCIFPASVNLVIRLASDSRDALSSLCIAVKRVNRLRSAAIAAPARAEKATPQIAKPHASGPPKRSPGVPSPDGGRAENRHDSGAEDLGHGAFETIDAIHHYLKNR